MKEPYGASYILSTAKWMCGRGPLLHTRGRVVPPVTGGALRWAERGELGGY